MKLVSIARKLFKSMVSPKVHPFNSLTLPFIFFQQDLNPEFTICIRKTSLKRKLPGIHWLRDGKFTSYRCKWRDDYVILYHNEPYALHSMVQQPNWWQVLVWLKNVVGFQQEIICLRIINNSEPSHESPQLPLATLYLNRTSVHLSLW